MRGGKYNSGEGSDLMYDDSAFQLFVVAFLAVYWVPVAAFRAYRMIHRLRHIKTPIEKAKEEWCLCSSCQDKAERIRKKTSGLKAYSMGDIIFVIVTILLAYTSVSVYRANMKIEPPFDPFNILGVTRTATEKQIKKSYRRLSVIHHPDKNRGDPTAGDRFIKITKAFAALTDEASKENFIKYGNPDGYMGTTWGLGLPEWVGEKSKSVLLVYGFFMALIFPTIVGLWWRKREQQMTGEIMKTTFLMFCETLNQTSRFRDLLAAFCGSDEFNSLYTSDNEDALREVRDTLRKKMGGLPKSKSVFEPSQSQIQNLMILTAHLAGLQVPKSVHYVLEAMCMRAEPLLTSMTDIVGVFQRPDCKPAWDKHFIRGHTTLLSRCLQLTHSVYQGIEEKSSPLMQIPHFTEREVKFCTSRSGSTKSIYDLRRMDTQELGGMLRDFDGPQLLDVKAFCDRFPVATLEVEAPFVEGEEDSSVHDGDKVTVRATLRVLRKSGSAFSPHVPQLPYRKEEVWWLWVADEKRLCPVEVKRLLPRMARGHDGAKRNGFDSEELKEGDGILSEVEELTAEERERRRRRDDEVEQLAAEPRITVFEVAFHFLAPRAGSYSLEVKATCDCYAGTAQSQLVKMDVLEALEIKREEVQFSSDEEDESEDESEEEEDEEASGNENGDGDSDDEYEYIEVTASESEEGDFADDDDDDDDFGVGGTSHGNPADE